MIVYVDTSALIALLDGDDTRHVDAVRTFRSLRGRAELVTTNYVELEAVAVARRRLGANAAARLIDSLLPLMRTIWIDEATHAAAIALYRSGPGSASLVDHVSFAVMRRDAIDQAFAYDSDFSAHGFRTVESTRAIHEPPASYGDDLHRSELVSVAEIASRSRRSVNTVQSWRRRHRDFPDPVAHLSAGPIWSWPTVSAWIAKRPPRRAAIAESLAHHS